MAKITGIGGVFFKHREGQKRLLKWYEETLNLTVSEFGISFLEPSVFTLVTFNRKDINFFISK